VVMNEDERAEESWSLLLVLVQFVVVLMVEVSKYGRTCSSS
jgi:hypothetical protein